MPRRKLRVEQGWLQTEPSNDDNIHSHRKMVQKSNSMTGVLDHFDIATKPDMFFQVKVCGRTASGKSSLISALCRQRPSSSHLDTPGLVVSQTIWPISVKKKPIESKSKSSKRKRTSNHSDEDSSVTGEDHTESLSSSSSSSDEEHATSHNDETSSTSTLTSTYTSSSTQNITASEFSFTTTEIPSVKRIAFNFFDVGYQMLKKFPYLRAHEPRLSSSAATRHRAASYFEASNSKPSPSSSSSLSTSSNISSSSNHTSANSNTNTTIRSNYNHSRNNNNNNNNNNSKKNNDDDHEYFDGYILVFSMIERASFEYVKAMGESIKDYVAIAVGTRCDMPHGYQIDEEELAEFSRATKIPICLVNCFADYSHHDGVSVVVEMLADHILQSQ